MTTFLPRSLRILLADDDQDVREALREFLGREGFTIFEADSGLKALEILNRERLSFSIMDVDMPGMTGIEVVRAMRRRRLPLPCILMSGDDSRQRQLEAREAGAFSLLPKPIALDLLRLNMSRLLAQHFGRHL